METRPTVSPYRFERVNQPHLKTWWICAYVICPHCGREHGHTWSNSVNPTPQLGWRCNPCGASTAGYVLTEPVA